MNVEQKHSVFEKLYIRETNTINELRVTEPKSRCNFSKQSWCNNVGVVEDTLQGIN